MELIQNICTECSDMLGDCVSIKNHNDIEMFLCKNCLCKAILLVKPIEVNKKLLEEIFDETGYEHRYRTDKLLDYLMFQIKISNEV